MGAFFGAVSRRDVVLDVFFGVDYHSHLGTRRAGMVSCLPEGGFKKEIHSIENTPFRTRFDHDLPGFRGTCAMGCISDMDPQPLLVRSHLGVYAISVVGNITNFDALVDELTSAGAQFMAMSSGNVNMCELVAALVNSQDNLLDGIRYAQEKIEGSLTLLIMTEDGHLVAARDRMGRLPVLMGKDDDGYCVSFESFAYGKLGYADEHELGPGEIVRIGPDGYEVLAKPCDRMRICAFLWVYYGYPNSNYEGVNVEVMRYRNGRIMARREEVEGMLPEVDYVAGVPDSGLPHGLGFAMQTGQTFARPFVKYTPTWPRSFMPTNQAIRNRVAKMKQIPVPELIDGKRLLLVDDSIVRGTQLRETVDFLYNTGAREVHMRSACPPIMYGCKYLSFSRSNSDYELIARRKIKELEPDGGEDHIAEYADDTTERGRCLLKSICEEMGFDSLRYQSLDGLLEAIGLDRDKVCTYCWDGRE